VDQLNAVVNLVLAIGAGVFVAVAVKRSRKVRDTVAEMFGLNLSIGSNQQPVSAPDASSQLESVTNLVVRNVGTNGDRGQPQDKLAIEATLKLLSTRHA
jgi:hypothetical protein